MAAHLEKWKLYITAFITHLSRSNSFMKHLIVHTAGTKSTQIKHHSLLQILASEDNGPFLMSCISWLALLIVIFLNILVTETTPF